MDDLGLAHTWNEIQSFPRIFKKAADSGKSVRHYELLINEHQSDAKPHKNDRQDDGQVVKSFGQATLAAVDRAVATKHGGQAAFALLQQNRDDEQNAGSDEGKSQNIFKVFHILN